MEVRKNFRRVMALGPRGIGYSRMRVFVADVMLERARVRGAAIHDIALGRGMAAEQHFEEAMRLTGAAEAQARDKRRRSQDKTSHAHGEPSGLKSIRRRENPKKWIPHPRSHDNMTSGT
jgi:hypothetical protein